MNLISKALERGYRGSRIGYTAACVYLRIKIPRVWDPSATVDYRGRDLK